MAPQTELGEVPAQGLGKRVAAAAAADVVVVVAVVVVVVVIAAAAAAALGVPAAEWVAAPWTPPEAPNQEQPGV